MANSNGIITAPVQVSDVQVVTAETASDFIRLFSSTKINMWSRYKPIRATNIDARLDVNNAYKGDILTPCGYNVKRAKTFIHVFNNQNWTYARPDGRNYPYRLGDFNKYCHTALCPVKGIKCPTKVAKGGTVKVSLIPNLATTGTGAGSITFDEIPIMINGELKSFSDLYFGVALYKASATSYADTYLYTTAETAGIFQEVQFTLPDGVAVGGQWKVIPFLATAKSVYPQLTTSTMPDIIPVPDVTTQVITVANQTELVYISLTSYWGEANNGKADLNVTVNLINNSEESVIFTQVTLLLYKGNSDNPYRQKILVETPPSKTVESGKSETYTYTFSNIEIGEHYLQVVSIPSQYSTDKMAVFLPTDTVDEDEQI